MPRTSKGFTLIELMIVIAVIAIVAGIAIPNLLAARVTSNETAAVATLRQIFSSQSQFQQGARCDEDQDGTGEYGGLLDMSGAPLAVTPRMTSVLTPPVLSTGFQTLSGAFNGGAAATRVGYNFQVFLPQNATAQPGAEPSTGFGTSPDGATVNAREAMWCAYAWPQGYNQSGNRTFFVNQVGDILQTEWDTNAAPPIGLAGYASGATNMTFRTGSGTLGNQPGLTRPWAPVD